MSLTFDQVLASFERRRDNNHKLPSSATLMAFRLDGSAAAGASTPEGSGSRTQVSSTERGER